MGLMLGEFVDDFTINVVDVFAMPQSGTVWNRIFFEKYCMRSKMETERAGKPERKKESVRQDK